MDAQHISLDGSAEAPCGLEVDEPVDEGAAGLLGCLAHLGVDEAIEDVGAHAELKSVDGASAGGRRPWRVKVGMGRLRRPWRRRGG
ncbi:hypothetical protein MUK42_08999 [Musa troglodytarum]|uniref:Uncharacterized protein n=1 Tax=Musa troglodytarum TaxID=320322 RepID=A0A9E7JBN9_9LILI|nr:hypothetical protein MUK42_08999 [Musa troglodytarum]